MSVNEFVQNLFQTIFIPAIITILTAALLIVKSYANKISKSLVAKNDAEYLEKIFSVKSHVIQEISSIVEAAVASNMQLADEMKANGQKLTDEQINQLAESAKKLVTASLPANVTDDDSSIMTILGGADKLNTIIDNLIEKYVYEYKIKKLAANNQPVILPQKSTTARKTTTPVVKASNK